MASSTATNSKYLDYAGLSHLKTVLDGRYAPISRTFITKRDEIDILTVAQITAYADLSTSSAGQSAFKLLKSGSYNVARSGSSELLINLGTNNGSTSALEFLSNYTHESRLKVRKIIDSNRVSGGFKELAWYSDIPGSLKNPYALTIQANGSTIDTYDGSVAKTINTTPTQFNKLTCFNKGIHVSGGGEDGGFTEAIITFGDGPNKHIQNDISGEGNYIENEFEPRIYIGERTNDLLTVRAPSISIGSTEYESYEQSKINIEEGNLTLFIDTSETPTQPSIEFNIDKSNDSEYYSQIDINADKVLVNGNEVSTKNHTHSYLPLSGGTMTGTISSQSIIPKANVSYNLGSTSNQFSVVYTRYVDTVSGYNLRLRAAGTEHINMLSGNVNVTANILPTKNNNYNLGSSATQWNNIYGKTLYENGTSLANKYSASGHTHSYVDSAGTASHAAVADYAAYAYYIATSNVVTIETINTLTDEEAEVVPAIPTGQVVISDSLRQFWVNVRNIIEDNEFVCASALTDLNTRLNNINASINLSVPNTSTKYNILGSPSTTGELNTAYCNSSVYMQGNNLYATSDERLKNFKEDIEVDLEKLRKLPKKYFTWKGENMMDIGTSAQELLKLYPELVSYDSVNDIYAVDYVKLSVIALAAVDTLYDRLKSTENRLKVIEDKLAKL